jgi:hypothetical protein
MACLNWSLIFANSRWRISNQQLQQLQRLQQLQQLQQLQELQQQYGSTLMILGTARALVACMAMNLEALPLCVSNTQSVPCEALQRYALRHDVPLALVL